MFDLSLPTCLRAGKGAWHYVWSYFGVFEPDFDVLYATSGGEMLKLTGYTEAGILVFHMGG